MLKITLSETALNQSTFLSLDAYSCSKNNSIRKQKTLKKKLVIEVYIVPVLIIFQASSATAVFAAFLLLADAKYV